MKKLQRNKVLSVGLIGLGKIGMGLDLNDISTENVFKSHLKSFYFNDKFKLEFVLDNDKSKLKVAEKCYKKINNFYNSIDQIEFFPEIIVLACDEKTNLDLFDKLKDNSKINFFFVEKPFRLKSHHDYKNYNNKIIINYIRKFSPFYINFKKNIANNIYGELKSIDIKYSKGIDNTVSHFVDLLFYLFGIKINFDDVETLNKPRNIKGETSCSFVVRDFLNLNSYVCFHAIHDLYAIELDFIFDNKRIRIINYEREVYYYDIDNDSNFPEYLNFVQSEKIKLNNIDYMKHVTNKLYNICNSKISNDFSIYRDLDVTNAIKKIKLKINE